MPSAFGAANLIVVEREPSGDFRFLVREREPDGTLVQTIDGPVIADTYAVARDTAGNLYVAEFLFGSYSRVRKYTPDGTDQGVLIDLGTLDAGAYQVDPEIVGIDRSGNIYVADLAAGHKDDLHRFTAAGAFSQTYSIPVALGNQSGACVSPDGTRYYYGDVDGGTGDALVRAYALDTETDLGTLYTFALGGSSSVAVTNVRVHASGDLLVAWDRAEPGVGTTTLTRLTSGGALLGEWEVSTPDALSTSLAVLPAAPDTVYVGVLVNAPYDVYTVSLPAGSVTLAFQIADLDLEDIAHVFDVACQPVLIIGSDTGHLYRRVGDTWTLVHTMSDSDLTALVSGLGWLTSDPSDLRRVVAVSDTQRDSVYSGSAGAAWTENNAGSTLRLRLIARDGATGDLYAARANGGGITGQILKSTDNGDTWSTFVADNGSLRWSVWVEGPWVYWTEGSTPVTIKRIQTDGSGEETVSYSGSISSNHTLAGGWGSGVIYLFDNLQAFSAGELWRITTSGPTVEQLADPPIASGHTLQWIVPLSATVAIMHEHDGSTIGAIWRTTDAGETWTKIVEHAALVQSAFGEAVTVARDEADHSRVAVIGSVPYYWESEDARTGAPPTFTQKSVSPQSDDFYWVGVGWANTCADGGGEGEPNAERRKRRRTYALWY